MYSRVCDWTRTVVIDARRVYRKVASDIFCASSTLAAIMD